MFLLIILLLVTDVQTQQSACSCICCTGQLCTPVLLGIFYPPSCTTETCLAQCRNSYPQCQTNNSDGQVLAQCSSNLSTISPLYNCQCNCCRTGSTTCTPSFVGYSTAYSCQPSSCSISCTAQYQNQCPNDYNGQTQGICIGLITTTTTTSTTSTIAVSTTIGSSSGNTCRCMCCQSGPNCSANINVGVASVSQCSSTVCTQACQNQYPGICPSFSYLGQTNGTCTNQGSGNKRCRCQCCGPNGCPSYEINTNGDCTSCSTLCQQQSSCGNTNTATYTCDFIESNTSKQFSLSLTIFLSILILPFFV